MHRWEHVYRCTPTRTPAGKVLYRRASETLLAALDYGTYRGWGWGVRNKLYMMATVTSRGHYCSPATHSSLFPTINLSN